MVEYCENCGATIKDNSKFCAECGAKIENSIPNLTNNLDYCPNCGKKVEHNEGFCQNCGTNLVSQEPKRQMSFFEKNKVPLIIYATVLIVLIIIAAALIFTAKPVDVGTKTVTVGINDFIIPGDYKIDPSSIDVDYTGYNAVFSQGYSNKEELIYISVMNIPPGVNGQEVLASNGGVQKNLMGVNGYYSEDGNGYYSFAFVDGAYLNVVTVSSPYVLDQITYRG